MKPIRFLGASSSRFSGLSRVGASTSRIRVVYGQVGREPADFKPLPTVGSGAYEIRIRGGAGRVPRRVRGQVRRSRLCLARFSEETRKTAQADIKLAAERYKLIGGQS
jgi:phage-related protein